MAKFRLRLTPQKREFFGLYRQASQNVIEISRLLVDLLARHPRDGDLIARIKELEHQGDQLTHDIVLLLNRTFVTPFDRDDMYRLAVSLDDICDLVDEAADNVGLYAVEEVPDVAKAQADVILRAAGKLDEAIQKLAGFKDSSEQLTALRELENEGDRLVREAIAGLFRAGEEPLFVIRWKDIHEGLEETVDALENAADVLEAILVKNR
jgi:predicted phosphate transport protein (TIGR00153 family)